VLGREILSRKFTVASFPSLPHPGT
jgi:hypothetical protein